MACRRRRMTAFGLKGTASLTRDSDRPFLTADGIISNVGFITAAAAHGENSSLHLLCFLLLLHHEIVCMVFWIWFQGVQVIAGIVVNAVKAVIHSGTGITGFVVRFSTIRRTAIAFTIVFHQVPTMLVPLPALAGGLEARNNASQSIHNYYLLVCVGWY